MSSKIHWAVFASGSGTNLQNFLNLEASGILPSQKISLIHSDRPCFALERAEKHQKPIFLKSTKDLDYEDQVIDCLRKNGVNRIFLLGYMKILKPSFFAKFKDPILNLHPSLLPKYKGLEAIRQAFDAGEESIGVSIHEVIPELDAGPILLQKSLVRTPHESLDSLTARVHELEYQAVKEYLLSLEAVFGVK